MGQKVSRAQPTNPTADYVVYLLPNNEEETLAQAHMGVAAQGNNAVILFPDPSDMSTSSSGSRKYNVFFIHNGRWMIVDGKRKEASIGNCNFNNAQLSVLSINQNIKVMSSKSPNYQNILNTALAFDGIQLSQLQKLPNVIHQNLLAPHLNINSIVAMENSSKTLYRLYQPEGLKRTVKKLLEHAILATANDIKEIKKILDAPLSSNPPNLNYLRELLCTPRTVMDYNNRIYYMRTLYQIALGAREYNVTSRNGIQVFDGLVEMLGEYFKKLPDGKMRQKQQYDAQFPQGFEEKEKERISNDSSELNHVIEVIASASDTDCQQTMALDSFHGYDLRPFSVWAVNDNEVLASAIYLRAAFTGLACQYRGLDGQVKTKIIPWDTIPDVPYFIDDIIKTKLSYLPTILEQLAEPGQFYSAEQIQKLKVLSGAIVCARSQNDFEESWIAFQDYMKSIAGGFIDFTVLKSLYQLRNYVEPKVACTTGYHSNPQLLLEAYQSYENNFLAFGNNWSAPKNVLCAQKVVGLAQRNLSACELQLHAERPFLVLFYGFKLERTFLFAEGGGSALPFDSDPCFQLGYNYVSVGRRRFGDGGLSMDPCSSNPCFWNFYVEQKHQRIEAYATSRKSIEEHSRDEAGLRRN